jgi:hypothetical protein
MAASHKPEIMDIADPMDDPMDVGEETVTPPTMLTNNKWNDSEMTEFSVMYQIPICHGYSIEANLPLHPKLLHALTNSFPESELQILNKHSQRVTHFDDTKWSDKQYYDDQFNHQVNIAQRLSVIAHRIRSIHPLPHLLQATLVSTFLAETNRNLIYSPDLLSNLDLPPFGLLTQPEDEDPTKHEMTDIPVRYEILVHSDNPLKITSNYTSKPSTYYRQHSTTLLFTSLINITTKSTISTT